MFATYKLQRHLVRLSLVTAPAVPFPLTLTRSNHLDTERKNYQKDLD